MGSILLLSSLGLAITFGLMRVINMAHGEMLMLGAYATYATQTFFHEHLPEHESWYLLAAVPVALGTTMAVGALLERTVIRFLYGRPLETLLATYGLSLLLIQTVRSIFGAQNVAVENPPLLSGGFEIFEGVVIPYNRVAVVLFTIVVVSFVGLRPAGHVARAPRARGDPEPPHGGVHGHPDVAASTPGRSRSDPASAGSAGSRSRSSATSARTWARATSSIRSSSSSSAASESSWGASSRRSRWAS